MARRLTATAPRVLMYHRFADGPHPRRLSKAAFEEQLQYLTRHFRVSRLRDVARSLRSGRPVEPRTVVLTVDDGYADFMEVAYPVLERYRVPATVFVATDFLDRNSWLWFDALHYALHTTTESRLQMAIGDARLQHDLSTAVLRDRAWSMIGERCLAMNAAGRASVLLRVLDATGVHLPEGATAEYRAMTWDDARRLDPSLIDFGSHSCSHPVLSRCTDLEIEQELCDSKRIIERQLNRRVDAFAYPHGEPADYDARAVMAAKRAGYACATVAHGTVLRRDANLFRLERLSGATDAMQFRSTVNGLEWLANRYRTWRDADTF